jgi:hypothetical protein
MLSTATLSSYKVDYLDSTVSSQLVDTLITQQIAALNDAGNNPMDLFLGATGKILLNVNGSNSLQISNSNAMTSVKSTAGLGLQLVPTDTSKTMVLGSVTFTETPTAQNMITDKPKLNIVSDLQLTGNEVITGDLLTAGALVASSMNILRDFTGARIGFGFRVTDNSNLELIKYDNRSNLTKRIAIFGSGDASGSNDTESFDLATGSNNYNNRMSGGLSLATSPWIESASNISYTFGGSIGVQTTTPSALLTIANSKNSDQTLVDPFLVASASNAAFLSVKNNGYVGIGTASPSNALDVKGDINFSGNLRSNGVVWSPAPTQFSTNGTKVYLASGSNLGIGLSTPAAPLQVLGSTILSTSNSDASAQVLQSLKFTGSDSSMSYAYVGAESTSTGGPNGRGGALSLMTKIGNSASVAGISIVEGKVGIAKTAPTVPLDVTGAIAATGDISTSGAFLTTSDARVKCDIVEADIDACYERVKALPLRQFKWCDGYMPALSNQATLGWIAQEVREVIPQAVSIRPENDIPDFHRLDTDMLIKHMYGCIQKMAKKIEALEARI